MGTLEKRPEITKFRFPKKRFAKKHDFRLRSASDRVKIDLGGAQTFKAENFRRAKASVRLPVNAVQRCYPSAGTHAKSTPLSVFACETLGPSPCQRRDVFLFP